MSSPLDLPELAEVLTEEILVYLPPFPKDLLIRIGVSYLTSEKPEDNVAIILFKTIRES